MIIIFYSPEQKLSKNHQYTHSLLCGMLFHPLSNCKTIEPPLDGPLKPIFWRNWLSNLSIRWPSSKLLQSSNFTLCLMALPPIPCHAPAPPPPCPLAPPPRLPTAQPLLHLTYWEFVLVTISTSWAPDENSKHSCYLDVPCRNNHDK